MAHLHEVRDTDSHYETIKKNFERDLWTVAMVRTAVKKAIKSLET